MKNLFLIFIIMFLVASCGNKKRFKIELDDQGSLQIPKKSEFESEGENLEPSVIFEDVLVEIFEKDCTFCHSGYDRFVNVKADLDDILREVLSDSMPQFGPPLSLKQKELLQEWASIGAPEQ